MLLDRTIGKAGTVAVGESSPERNRVGVKAKERFSPELAAMASQFAATLRMFPGSMAAWFCPVPELPLVPYPGFLFSGAGVASVIRQENWAIVQTRESELAPAGDAVERGLEDILKIAGVRFAAYYSPDGGVIACKQTIGFAPDVRATATQLVASSTAALLGLATAFSHLSKASWTPVHAWLYAGGDWVVAVSPCCWILAEAGEAETQELYRALVR